MGAITLQGQSGFHNPSPSAPRHGINLDGPVDWSTEQPFVDVFRLSRPWISQQSGAGWGEGPPLDLDEHGWIRSLAPNAYAETLLCTIPSGHYPSGRYVVLYDGVGTLGFWGAASLVSQTPGRIEIDVNPAQGAIFLRLSTTDPNDYVRNIRVLMPGHEATYQDNPFRPDFLRRWRGQTVLRFMDWMHTNNSHIQTWSQRPTRQSATYGIDGVAIEDMVDLANRLRADPWFCMPHQADDSYVQQFATLVRDTLDPGLRVYIEYSNEVWNSQFSQHHYAAAQGQALNFSSLPWEAAWYYTAYRSRQIFDIWEQVFGGRERLVRVLASQASNAYVSERILTFQNTYLHADALAIAPYVSLNVHAGSTPSEATVQGWTVDQALDHMHQTALPEALGWIAQQKALANTHNLALIAYEGGQHMVGIYGAENNETLTQLFHAANGHARMGDLYTAYLNGWSAAGGGLFANFSSVGEWTKWGSWGLKQYVGHPTPKYWASHAWARAQGQTVPPHVKGTIQLGGLASSAAGLVFSIQIRNPGETTPLHTLEVTLGAGGTLVFSSPVQGSYDLAIQGGNWLRRRVANVAIGPQGTDDLVAVLINGDVNGDNVVNLADFLALRGAFGTNTGDPTFVATADLNRDGTVNLLDFLLLRSSFGQSGDL